MWSSGSNLRFLIFYMFQNKYVILSCCKSLGGEKKKKNEKGICNSGGSDNGNVSGASDASSFR